MMMKIGNSKFSSIIWIIILCFVMVAFVFGGMGIGGGSGSNNDFVAKVNDVKISKSYFQDMYRNNESSYRAQLGDDFIDFAEANPSFTINLKKNVLDNIINTQLFSQYAEQLEFRASDEDIKRSIVMDPKFARDGKFDNKLYTGFLAMNQLTADQYAEYLRHDLTLYLLRNELLSTAFVTPAQEESLIKLFAQQREVRLARLDIADQIKQQEVSDAEIDQYYQNNQNAYVEPEMVKIQYVDINKNDMLDNIKVDDEVIAQYYQDNKSQFTSPTKQHLAYIQLKTEDDANEVYLQLEEGADFAELAKDKSLDKLTAQTGGDISWVVDGALPIALENTIRDVSVGAFTKPIELDNSFHIFKVIERQEAMAKDLNQVKTGIKVLLEEELLNNEFYRVEKLAGDKAFENKDSLTDVAEATGIKIQETGYFTRSDVPENLRFSRLSNNIFDAEMLESSDNSDVINVENEHSIIFRIVDRKAERIKTLAETEAGIKHLLQKEKAEKLMLEKAQTLVAKIEQDGEKSIEAEGFIFGQPEQYVYYKRTNPDLDHIIFDMDMPVDNKATYQTALTSNGKVVIVALDKVSTSQLSTEEKNMLKESLLQNTQAKLEETLVKTLRAKAEIKLNNDYLQEQFSEEKE